MKEGSRDISTSSPFLGSSLYNLFPIMGSGRTAIFNVLEDDCVNAWGAWPMIFIYLSSEFARPRFLLNFSYNRISRSIGYSINSVISQGLYTGANIGVFSNTGDRVAVSGR